MSTHRTRFARIVCVYLDRHRTVQESLIRNHAVQLRKAPFGVDYIGLALLFCGGSAMLAPGALSDVRQMLQTDDRMGVPGHDAFGNDMIGVLLQPSLPTRYRHQSSGRRAGAFLLKTLPQSCVMIGFGDHLLPSMERAISPRGRGDSQIANSNVHTCYSRKGLGRGVSYLKLKGHQQVELLLGLVIPELGRSDVGPFLDESDMLGIARVGNDDTAFQGQNTHVLLTLEAVILAVLVGQGGRDIFGSLIKPFVAFLGFARCALLIVLLDLCPQRLVG